MRHDRRRSGYPVLIGLMGSGKSTIGASLAEALGVPFVDLDAYIVAWQGRSIPQIFAEQGEQGFRALESAALKDQLGRPCVLATGGGVVTRAENRALLRAHSPVIWLRARPEVLAARIAGDRNRPLIAGTDTLSRLRELAEQRAPMYAACADWVLDCDTLSAEQAVARIRAWLADETPLR